MTLRIANKLYELRKQNKMSQEELAEKLGVSRQAVSKWERAEASPTTDSLILLAQLYNISLDELLEINTANTYSDNSDDNDTPTENIDDFEDESTDTEEDDGIMFFTGNTFQESNDNVPFMQTTENDDALGFFSSNTEYKESEVPQFSQSETTYRTYNTENYATPSQEPERPYSYGKKTGKFIKAFDRFSRTNIFKFIFRGFPFILGMLETFLYLASDECINGGFLVAFYVLAVPLFYLTVASLKHRNPNIFPYPIVSIILCMIFAETFSYSSNTDVLIVLFVFTIPLYYIAVNLNRDFKLFKRKNRK